MFLADDPDECALCVSRTSLIGHLSGIVVGLLYTAGPLKSIMKTCAGRNVKAFKKQRLTQFSVCDWFYLMH